MAKYISLDVETYPTRPGLLVPKLICGALSDGNYSKIHIKDDIIKTTYDLLIDPEIIIVGNKICYDLAVMANHDYRLLYPIFKAYEQGRIEDINVNQQLIDIATGQFEYFEYDGKKHHNKHSLAQMSLRYQNKTILKGKQSWQLRFGELDGIDPEDYPEEAKKYVVTDAEDTLSNFWLQKDFAGKEIPTRILQTCGSFALHLMSIWGVRTNRTKVLDFQRDVALEKAGIEKRLRELGYIKPDGVKNTKLIKEKIVEAYEKRGLHPPLTDKKNICIDKDSLKGSGDLDLIAISRFVGLDKEEGTFIPILLAASEQPFNPSWNILVTSGRTSCGGEENVGNLQNQKRKGPIRQCFEPRPKNYYCSTDLDTAELRSLAEVCLDLVGFSVMADDLNSGKDPHLAFAASLLNIEYANALANKRSVEVKNARQFGKIFNFGAPGGQKPPSLVEYAKGYGVNLSLEKAKDIYNNWLDYYKEMPEYFNYHKRITGFGNYVTTKHHLTGFVRGEVGYTALLNQQFQHLTACCSKEALWRISKECYIGESTDGMFTVENKSPLFGARPGFFEHDEVITEISINKSHEGAHRQAELMIQGANQYIKRVVNGCKPALMTAWYKDAEPVYDNEERLTIWEPQKEDYK